MSFFMNKSKYRARRRLPVPPVPAGIDRRDSGSAAASLLHAFVVDERLAVVEQGPQFGVLRVREIALRLDDEEVRGHAHFELALLGLESPLGQAARRMRRRLTALKIALDLQCGVGDLGGDLQLERAELRRPTCYSWTRARRMAGIGGAGARSDRSPAAHVPVRIVLERSVPRSASP